MDTLWGMGQLPFYPPNVAGWPTGDRWVSPSMALAKAAMAVDSPAIKTVVDAPRPGGRGAQALLHVRGQQPDTPGAQARRCQRTDLSHRKSDRARILLALCLSSPEFTLA